ncbi:MAG: hypothetical protein RL336_1327 [Pseudomonadota bacterium]
MALAENLIKLRKQAGWSQEALGAQIGVSRQSVSKWESGKSVPDLDKVVKLAEAFGVPTDTLLKGDATAVKADEIPQTASTEDHASSKQADNKPVIALAQAQHYVHTNTTAARQIAKGVALCVSSAAPMFALMALFDNQTMAVGLGVIAIMLMVVKGITFFIGANQLQESLDSILLNPFDTDSETQLSLQARLREFAPEHQKQLSIGVGFFVLCVAPLMFAVAMGATSATILLTLIALLVSISLGLLYVIPASAHQEALKYILNNGDKDAGKSQDTLLAEKVAGIYWPLVVAVYLGWSFWTMNWGVTWIVFPVAGVAFAALVALTKVLKKS